MLEMAGANGERESMNRIGGGDPKLEFVVGVTKVRSGTPFFGRDPSWTPCHPTEALVSTLSAPKSKRPPSTQDRP